MTDTALPANSTPPTRTLRGPDLSEARLKRRYGAERRFRIYGLIAIGLAVAMLATLVTTIVSKGWPAFFQAYVTLEFTFDETQVNADGTGNWRAVMNDALYSRFPEVTERRQRSDLRGLLSGDTDIRLRDYVLENPDAIGETRAVQVMVDDDIDTFVKGQITEISTLPTAGILDLVPVDDTTYRVLAGANDFAPALEVVKAALAVRADRLEVELGFDEKGLAQSRQDLAAATGEERQRLAQLVERQEADIEAKRAEIADLRDRATRPGGQEDLDGDLPSFLINVNGGTLKLMTVSATQGLARVLLAPESAAPADPGSWTLKVLETSENNRRVKDASIAWVMDLQDRGQIETRISDTFFTAGASREPEQAGIWGAVVGSFLTLIVCLALSFPVGVLAAVYLEEFAPKNRLTDLIEVNINNLAAVPSIVFGLLGLAVFLNFFGMPRSAPVVGGVVLSLMTLPTIIITSRAALKAVPPSIREAALGVGASKLQTITHHVLPLAMPGMLTGTIIGMAQALGETAPLLMIGMVAFVVDIPGGFTDPATVLPVQVYMWSDFPERAFEARTSAAIMVLLAFLICMNALAVILRKRFERRW